MAKRKSPQVPAPELYPSTATRSEALSEALQARRTPQPPREFSTLVERSEPPRDPLVCADARNCVAHAQYQVDLPDSYREKTVAPVSREHGDQGDDLEPRSVRAGVTESGGDVVDDERECQPCAGASEQAHERRDDGHDAAQTLAT